MNSSASPSFLVTALKILTFQLQHIHVKKKEKEGECACGKHLEHCIQGSGLLQETKIQTLSVQAFH